MVFQDTILFSRTIGENISYGKPNASRDEIIKAAKNANAYDFIMNMPRRMSMERIIIIGKPGSGKSTLALKLGKKLDLPVVHIDKIYWTEGWVKKNKALS